MSDSKQESDKSQRGPEPERLKIGGDWQDAVKKAIEAEPPKDEHSERDEACDDADTDGGSS